MPHTGVVTSSPDFSYLGYVYATTALLERTKTRNRATIVQVARAGLISSEVVGFGADVSLAVARPTNGGGA
jgi:hypothetical protein